MQSGIKLLLGFLISLHLIKENEKNYLIVKLQLKTLLRNDFITFQKICKIYKNLRILSSVSMYKYVVDMWKLLNFVCGTI